jgi:lipocalin-like protein
LMFLIVWGERPKPTDVSKITDQDRADLLRTMVAYGGTYTLDDRAKTITTHVDIS